MRDGDGTGNGKRCLKIEGEERRTRKIKKVRVVKRRRQGNEKRKRTMKKKKPSKIEAHIEAHISPASPAAKQQKQSSKAKSATVPPIQDDRQFGYQRYRIYRRNATCYGNGPRPWNISLHTHQCSSLDLDATDTTSNVSIPGRSLVSGFASFDEPARTDDCSPPCPILVVLQVRSSRLEASVQTTTGSGSCKLARS